MPPEIKTYPAVLKERIHEYGDVYTFIFEKPKDLMYEAGNYVHIRIKTVPEPHKAVREMSFASAPHDEDVVFTITTKSGSPWQQALLTLRSDDSVELFKIKGHLHVPDDGTLIMIAGGIGITPFRSIIRQHTITGLLFTPTLVHIARENYLFENELEMLPFEQHRIVREQSENTLSALREKNPNALYMIAGTPSFVDGIGEVLKAKGIPEVLIQTDSFKGLT